MNTETSINETFQQNALSLYQEGPMDDFPILKAFQQYIDAEQEKARKRMATLCVCFAVLMGLVIAVFMVLLYAMNERNQSLNDRLVEYAIKDRDRQSVAVPAVQPQTDAALKAMTETLATLQRQLAEERRQKAVAPVAPAKTPQQIAAEEQQRAEQERLIREKARLEAEKKLLAEEKERLRQQEVEQHRRRLYPDYYAQQEKQQAAPAVPSPRAKPAAAKKAELSDEDIADILREADAGASEKQQPAAAKKTPEKVQSDDDAIEYFKDDGEYQIPVDIKGKKSSWRVPLD